MAKTEKWKLKRYLKRVKKAYKKLHKRTNNIPDVRGDFFYNLHRTETILQQLLTEDKDITKMKRDINSNTERQKIIRARIRNLIEKYKVRKKAKLNYQDLIYDKRMLSRESKILEDEKNILRKEVNKSMPALEKALKKDLEKQVKILMDELERFNGRLKEKIHKKEISYKFYKWYIRPHIERLRYFHKTFFF
jgi:hypothetical protein